MTYQWGLASNIPSSSKVTFYEHSITDHDFMQELLLKENFDYGRLQI